MAEYRNELILQTESGQSVAIDLRNAIIRSSAPTTATAARIGMQCYVVSGGTITAEYVCTAVSGSTYTWTKREVSGGSADIATITEAMILTDTAADGTETHKLALIRSDGSEIIVELPQMGIALSDVVVIKTEDPTSSSNGNTGQLWVNSRTSALWVCISGGNVSSTSWLQIGGGTGGGSASEPETFRVTRTTTAEEIEAAIAAKKLCYIFDDATEGILVFRRKYNGRYIFSRINDAAWAVETLTFVPGAGFSYNLYDFDYEINAVVDEKLKDITETVVELNEDIIPGKNLFDAAKYLTNSPTWQYITLTLSPNSYYVFSSNIPYAYISTMRVFVFNSSDPADYIRQVHAGKNRIIRTLDDGIVKIQYRNDTGMNLLDYWYQLEAGTTATEYEPFGEPRSQRLENHKADRADKDLRSQSLAERRMGGYTHGAFSCAAHRGKMDVAPENTIHAFRAAVEAGFDTLESDIWFTTDGVPVMLHDETINRTSNGSGASNSFSYAQLLELDFGSWFDAKYSGTKIMTFTEFCEFCRATGRRALIEIKDPTATEEEIQLVLDIAKEYGLEQEICFGANADNVNSKRNAYVLLAKAPYADLQIITEYGFTEETIETALELQNGRNRVYVCSGVWSEDLAELCKRHGLGLAVFLVDDEQTAMALPKYVTYVISNGLNVNKLFFDNAMGK